MAALTLQDSEKINGEKIVADVADQGTATLHQFPQPAVVTLEEFQSTIFPERVALLSPWLLTQSLTMIYAMRGIGKTHLALGIAFALGAGDEFLGWKVERPVKVLYLDGEMPGADLQKRLREIQKSASKKAEPGFLKIMTPDLQPEGVMPNLYTREGQNAITDAAADVEVIIIDNLSSLVRGGKENDSESWQFVADWLLQMRAAGKSVLLIHHAGKGGQQRGTSRREDLLDTVIALRRPDDYKPQQGARFEIHFEKSRALHGQDVTPIEAKLYVGDDGVQRWELKQIVDPVDQQIVEMTAAGMSTREIGEQIGMNAATVSRRQQDMRNAGRLTTERKKAGRPPKSSSSDTLDDPLPVE